MNDFEIRDLYKQVQELEVRMNALETKCNNCDDCCCESEEE
jgi:hypothetical protein